MVDPELFKRAYRPVLLWVIIYLVLILCVGIGAFAVGKYLFPDTAEQDHQIADMHRANAVLQADLVEQHQHNDNLEATLDATPTPTDTATPTSTATATFTPVPTNTRWPTNTPLPTNTRIPTNTPIPTPTPGPDPETEFKLGADIMCQFANAVVSNFTSGAFTMGDCRLIMKEAVEGGNWYMNEQLRKTATPKPTVTATSE